MGELFPKITRYTKKPTKISNVGDILVCVRATLGNPIFSDETYCLGRGIAAILSSISTTTQPEAHFCKYPVIR